MVGLLTLVFAGAIYGSAWVCVRPTEELLGRLSGGVDAEMEREVDVTRWVGLEVLEARKVCALPGRAGAVCGMEGLWAAYVAVDAGLPDGEEGRRQRSGIWGGLMQRVRAWLGRPVNFGGTAAGNGTFSGVGAEGFTFDLFGAGHWQRYENGVLLEEGENCAGGVVPFVRYENAADPAAGTRVGPAGSGAVDVGVGEVEPLLGLQDELNTRLSDRARFA